MKLFRLFCLLFLLLTPHAFAETYYSDPSSAVGKNTSSEEYERLLEGKHSEDQSDEKDVYIDPGYVVDRRTPTENLAMINRVSREKPKEKEKETSGFSFKSIVKKFSQGNR